MRFTPYEIGLDGEHSDQTQKNLAKLAMSPGTPGETFSFGFFSDTHDGYDRAARIMGAFEARPNLALVVHGGDFTDFGTQQEYRWFYDETANRRLPIFVAPGNHDALTNGRQLYQTMFGPENFVFRYASVKFVVFNTNSLEYKRASPDLDWLEREVNERAPDEGVIVVTHHPPESRPHFLVEDSIRYRQIQRDAGVLANLHGHVHEIFLYEQDGPTAYLRVKAALGGGDAIITTNGKTLSWERCNLEVCEPPEVLVP